MITHGLRVAGLLGIGTVAVAARNPQVEQLVGAKVSESIAVAALVGALILFLRFLRWERERQDLAEKARAEREVARDKDAREAFRGQLQAVLDSHARREEGWFGRLEKNTAATDALTQAVGRLRKSPGA